MTYDEYIAANPLRKGRLTLAAIQEYVRQGYDMEKLLIKYGYVDPDDIAIPPPIRISYV